MRRFNFIMGGLFVLFALLQINDPDPLLWISIYLAAGFIAVQNGRGKQLQLVNWALLLFCLGYALLLFVGRDGVYDWFNEHQAENLVQSMKATKPWIEQTREFGGLLIIVVTVCLQLFRAQKSRNTHGSGPVE